MTETFADEILRAWAEWGFEPINRGQFRLAVNAAFEVRVKEAVEKAVAVAQYECGCAKCVNPPEGK